MKHTLLTLILAVLPVFVMRADDFPKNDPESCTSIMVGRKASTNGAVITSHTCDGNYRAWMEIAPGATYEEGATMEIFKNRLHSESVNGRSGMTLKGVIPQVAQTYAFLDTAYPCLNEKKLAMGETTISGRRDLVNKDGMFMIEELQRVALQRCTTARDAIRLMGELIEKYGYGDWGECLTIADSKEVWHFEVFGEGPKKIGGVWAAIRIPDDHVGVSANIPRISKINIKDTENCMASKNVFDVAKKLGFWDGKEPFCFWKAYGGGTKAFRMREFYIFDQLAPSLNLSYDAEELPISIKPDKQVSVEKVMNLLASTYEGSDFDVTKNLKIAVKDRNTGKVDSVLSPVANPWMGRDIRNLINALKPGTVDGNRLVSVPQCAYSTVIEVHEDLPDAIGAIAWVSFDNPGQSPRIPIFSGTTKLPECFEYCGQPRYDESTILWKFREANKLATVRWGATRDEVYSAVQYFIDKGKREIPFVQAQYMDILKQEGEEAAAAYITGYVSDFTGATVLRWEELAEIFWARFARGF